MDQLTHHSVCQICGRVADRGSPDWLDDTWVKDPRYRVVRCPKHWSEWALRSTVTGRPRWRVQRMWYLRSKYGHWSEQSPFMFIPTSDAQVEEEWDEAP